MQWNVLLYPVECILTINTVPKNRNLKDLLGSNFDSGLFSITVCAMASPKAIKDPEAKKSSFCLKVFGKQDVFVKQHASWRVLLSYTVKVTWFSTMRLSENS